MNEALESEVREAAAAAPPDSQLSGSRQFMRQAILKDLSGEIPLHDTGAHDIQIWMDGARYIRAPRHVVVYQQNKAQDALWVIRTALISSLFSDNPNSEVINLLRAEEVRLMYDCANDYALRRNETDVIRGTIVSQREDNAHIHTARAVEVSTLSSQLSGMIN